MHYELKSCLHKSQVNKNCQDSKFAKPSNFNLKVFNNINIERFTGTATIRARICLSGSSRILFTLEKEKSHKTQKLKKSANL